MKKQWFNKTIKDVENELGTSLDKEKVVNTLNSEFERDFKVGAKKVIKDFNNLPDVEKFELMKYLGMFDIKLEIIPK